VAVIMSVVTTHDLNGTKLVERGQQLRQCVNERD
jgi:hypothetical protein